MAPYNLRGALNILFQLAVTIGIFAAQLINYGTQVRMTGCTCVTVASHCGIPDREDGWVYMCHSGKPLW
jgi:hypothetical protein